MDNALGCSQRQVCEPAFSCLRRKLPTGKHCGIVGGRFGPFFVPGLLAPPRVRPEPDHGAVKDSEGNRQRHRTSEKAHVAGPQGHALHYGVPARDLAMEVPNTCWEPERVRMLCF